VLEYCRGGGTVGKEMEMLAELTLFKAFLVSTEERIMWEMWTERGHLYKFTQCRYLVGGPVHIDAHTKQWRHSSHLHPSHCPSGNSEALRKSLSLCTARVRGTLQDSHCTHFVNTAYLPACSYQFTQRLILSMCRIQNERGPGWTAGMKVRGKGKERTLIICDLPVIAHTLVCLVYPEIPCSGCVTRCILKMRWLILIKVKLKDLSMQVVQPGFWPSSDWFQIHSPFYYYTVVPALEFSPSLDRILRSTILPCQSLGQMENWGEVTEVLLRSTHTKANQPEPNQTNPNQTKRQHRKGAEQNRSKRERQSWTSTKIVLSQIMLSKLNILFR